MLFNLINLMSIGFQTPATTVMEAIVDMHHYVFFYLILVFVFVIYMYLHILYMYYFIPTYLYDISFKFNDNSIIFIKFIRLFIYLFLNFEFFSSYIIYFSQRQAIRFALVSELQYIIQAQYYPVNFPYRQFPFMSDIVDMSEIIFVHEGEKPNEQNNISLELASFQKIEHYESEENYNLVFQAYQNLPIIFQVLASRQHEKILVSRLINHHSNLEIIQTLIPSFFLFLIALPSFALLYEFDEILAAAMNFKVIGYQQFQTYETLDLYINKTKVSSLYEVMKFLETQDVTLLKTFNTIKSESNNKLLESFKKDIELSFDFFICDAVRQYIIQDIMKQKNEKNYLDYSMLFMSYINKIKLELYEGELKEYTTFKGEYPQSVDSELAFKNLFNYAFYLFNSDDFFGHIVQPNNENGNENLNVEKDLNFSDDFNDLLNLINNKELDENDLNIFTNECKYFFFKQCLTLLPINFFMDLFTNLNGKFDLNVLPLELKKSIDMNDSLEVYLNSIDENLMLNYIDNFYFDVNIDFFEFYFNFLSKFSLEVFPILEQLVIKELDENFFGDVSQIVNTFDSVMVAEENLKKGEKRLLEVDNPLILPFQYILQAIITAGDVLHSQAIPSFGIKVDAVPGRLNQVQFLITRPGTFYGQCSELCGLNHGFMPIVIKVPFLKQN